MLLYDERNHLLRNYQANLLNDALIVLCVKVGAKATRNDSLLVACVCVSVSADIAIRIDLGVFG